MNADDYYRQGQEYRKRTCPCERREMVKIALLPPSVQGFAFFEAYGRTQHNARLFAEVVANLGHDNEEWGEKAPAFVLGFLSKEIRPTRKKCKAPAGYREPEDGRVVTLDDFSLRVCPQGA